MCLCVGVSSAFGCLVQSCGRRTVEMFLFIIIISVSVCVVGWVLRAFHVNMNSVSVSAFGKRDIFTATTYTIFSIFFVVLFALVFPSIQAVCASTNASSMHIFV